MTDDSLAVDQEQTTQSNRSVEQNPVIAGNVFSYIRNHRELDIADAALVRRKRLPCKVGIFGVRGNADNFAAAFFEFLILIVERQNFRRTYKRKIHRVKEQNNIFAFQRGKFKLAKGVVAHNGIRGKIGCFSCDQCRHDTFSFLNSFIQVGSPQLIFVCPEYITQTAGMQEQFSCKKHFSRISIRCFTLKITGKKSYPHPFTIRRTDRPEQRPVSVPSQARTPAYPNSAKTTVPLHPESGCRVPQPLHIYCRWLLRQPHKKSFC